MGRSDGKSTTKRAHDRGLLVEYILDEQKGRKKPPTWEGLASVVLGEDAKADYVQCLLQDQSIPGHVRTWPRSSEACKTGGVKRERSNSTERPAESPGGEEETAVIESGATNAGGADGQPLAEGVNPFLDAVTVFINYTLGGEKAFVSTLQLQLATLELCVACRHVPSLTLRVTRKAFRYQKAGLNSSSRVPILRPSTMRGKYVKEALLSKHHKPIDCSSALNIVFGEMFNKPIATIPWPRSLRQLELGTFFDQQIVSVKWPPSLQKITFNSLFNQPVEGISWPHHLSELDLGFGFNQPIEDVAWPKSLRILSFGPCFNQPIERVEWSPLVNLELEVDFDQPISQVEWPESLQRLTFGDSFDREIDHVKWPSLLQELAFGDTFNKEIENVSWPDRLKKLTFGCKFDQPIERVTWPTCLEVLLFGYDFNQSVKGTKLPASLKKLALGPNFEQPLDNVLWPQALEHVHLENVSYVIRLGSTVWPPSVRVTTGDASVADSCEESESGSDF